MMITPSTLLLHTCCAPCSCIIIDRLLMEGITPTLFFYNPNIHPQDEYSLRKASVIAYAHKRNVALVDADYEPAVWHQAVAGLEHAPERGARCTRCFDLRLERTALYACQNGFAVFATTNGIGRWKDLQQVNAAGHRAATLYKLRFLDRNWRANHALAEATCISNANGFYQQRYCGCIYSRSSL